MAKSGKPINSGLDLKNIFKILAGTHERIDNALFDILKAKYKQEGRGVDKLDTTQVLAHVFGKGIRYGIENNKGNKRIAQQFIRALYQNQIEDFKARKQAEKEKRKADLKEQIEIARQEGLAREVKELTKILREDFEDDYSLDYTPENITKVNEKKTEDAKKGGNAGKTGKPGKIRPLKPEQTPDVKNEIQEVKDEVQKGETGKGETVSGVEEKPEQSPKGTTDHIWNVPSKPSEAAKEGEAAKGGEAAKNEDTSTAGTKQQPTERVKQPTEEDVKKPKKGGITKRPPGEKSLDDFLFDYSVDNFTLSQQEKVLRSREDDKAKVITDIIDKEYAQLFKKAKIKIADLEKEARIGGLGFEIQPVISTTGGDSEVVVQKWQYSLFELEKPELLSIEEFNDLTPRSRAKELQRLKTIWERGLKTKGKRKKYVRENLRRRPPNKNVSGVYSNNDLKPTAEEKEMRDAYQGVGIPNLAWIFSTGKTADLYEDFVEHITDKNQGLLSGFDENETQRIEKILKEKFGFKLKDLRNKEFREEIDFTHEADNYKGRERLKEYNFYRTIASPYTGKETRTGGYLKVNRDQLKLQDIKYPKSEQEIKEILSTKGMTRAEKLNAIAGESKGARAQKIKDVLKEIRNETKQKEMKIREAAKPLPKGINTLDFITGSLRRGGSGSAKSGITSLVKAGIKGSNKGKKKK